ncbi:MAG: 50S ribosomal protein L30e [Desulfurococcales archaeon]|nr:50S ribosomal protein L30e [Desulfurococcales archaeon]MCE4605426.1 50S ribosomal protein L30e [Desulfurococcales archaeon]
MSVSFERELRNLIKTGKYYLGVKQAMKALKLGKAKMLIVAENTPPEYKRRLLYYAKLAGTPVYIYRGTSIALGLAAGKPFRVSVITVLDEGQSRITELV